MTESELREIIESQGLAGLTASIFTNNRVYIGRVARINVATLMLMEPTAKAIGEVAPTEVIGTPSVADTADPGESGGAVHRYVAIAIEKIEAIGF
ncbi:MAG: hypothetical protein COW32_06715 [Candidatus Aquicultor secundus]|uniref:Uncharacterized protein n=1 Tax=Candidatus Aquicultor secundus TaxID=1973895 RepID=A0A2M7T936_9ACTN|nr:hypothetical protein [Candidatus Aquicultor secundus]NCO66409.1 hypothetical protein [Solirubrobacter sp.]OIO84921.1 MAG: hypothetical protein AUK32_08005 [Candidatus Aquicultor secundus]PIU26899.1 MAG: hypothetical protein COT10_06275 [Candidatus Aquicultor secundus]PIW22038.1 MAG: hypothetical protein COW32_06715 [Candidatus Aquicultor secundus]PIX52882.1 MAG: hypothetical protein COZ51_01770 [Candidatus Aquicultor secundus]